MTAEGSSLPGTTDVVIVGAGPAGLSVAACLGKAGVPYVLVERAHAVAPAWRGHYDRLHLHTNRRLSGLPFHPMPRHYPKYPSRDQVVAYLQDYAEECGIVSHVGVEVRSLRPSGEAWEIRTDQGPVRGRAVVIATGTNGRPHRPTWPGLDHFPGPVLHSSEYKNGGPFEGKDVLVVGFGNSGGEIALDIVEWGGRPRMSVRGAVNVIPRDILGVPILAIALGLHRLPPRLADALSWPLLKAHYPSYRRLGLRKSRHGPFTQIAKTGKVPLLDIGTVPEIRRGRIRVSPDLVRFEQDRAVFEDGTSHRADAVVLATGYAPAVEDLLPSDLGVLDDRGHPRVSGRESAAPGLYFCGYYVAPTGMFRELAIEAERITASIAATLR